MTYTRCSNLIAARWNSNKCAFSTGVTSLEYNWSRDMFLKLYLNRMKEFCCVVGEDGSWKARARFKDLQNRRFFKDITWKKVNNQLSMNLLFLYIAKWLTTQYRVKDIYRMQEPKVVLVWGWIQDCWEEVEPTQDCPIGPQSANWGVPPQPPMFPPSITWPSPLPVSQ